MIMCMDERSHWSRWHDDYDDPGSSLAWRLSVVRRRLGEALDRAPAGPVRLLSLCAGQGRDVIDVLADHPRGRDVSAVLVELDAANCAYARDQLKQHRLTDVEVRCEDAATPAAYADAVPADLLLLCGIFGNISAADVEGTVRNCSRLCAPAATVLWTRHRKPPDLTVDIRRWFGEAGFEELAFDTDERDGAATAVGTQLLQRQPRPFDPQLTLFTFLR